MRALRFEGEHPRVATVDTPVPGPGEALVKVRLAGVCNTDLEIVRGYMGFTGTLGHEFVGELADGQRVVGEINLGCGACPACAAGLSRHCPTRTVLGILGKDGAFAELLTLPERNLHPVPASITDEQAVLVEPLAAALEILDQVTIEPATRVLLLGAGKLGQLIARVIASTGARLTVLGRSPAKLNLLEAEGIAVTTEPPPAGSQDLVIEATGNQAGLELALQAVRPRGTVVLKSTFAGTHTWNAAKVVIDELTIVGSRCGRFEAALRWLEETGADLSPLVSDRFPLSRGDAALDRAAEDGVLKVLLDPAG
ncbi:MAG: alcohol dehydrogenase catalytic domain-containing protein [Deltaproteobacteria bacterium]|nr:alcohol dehydrogenase catalytic domain-containing protein [Deltaproteobacteria bacterium]